MNENSYANATKCLNEWKEALTRQRSELTRQIDETSRKYKALGALLREMERQRGKLERNMAVVDYILEVLPNEDNH